MNISKYIISLVIFSPLSLFAQEGNFKSNNNMVFKTDEEWKSILTPEQYRICRLKGTEPPGSGKYNKHFEKGYYQCAACGLRLFDSDTKYDSGTGWPSFYDIHKKGNLEYQKDTSYGMIRTEISCAQCGAHLGHVFDDGPAPTGLRYCVNSLALEFIPASSAQ